MKASDSTNMNKSQQVQGAARTFPSNCDFMKNLSQSEFAQKQQQNGDDYNQIYQTLSSGVYENTNGYDIQSEESSQTNEKQPHQSQPHLALVQKANSQVQIKAQENMGTQMQYEQIDSQQQRKSKQAFIGSKKNNIQSKLQLKQNSETIYQNRQQQHYIDMNQQSSSTKKEINTYQKQGMQKQSKSYNEQEAMRDEEQIHESTNKGMEESIIIARKDEKVSVQKNANEYQVLEEQMKQYNFIVLNKAINNLYHSDQAIKIRIVGYEQEYFLKIETQIFQIQVQKKQKTYSVKRRYADFANLQRLIGHHYFGYIIYPFPQKSLQFFAKLKLSIGTEQEKMVLIEKRLFELQQYLNFLLSHRQISKSIVLQIFLEESQQTFHKQMNNLLSISVQQEKEFQIGAIEENYNSIKKIMRSSFSFFSYLSPAQDNNFQAKLKQIQQQSNKNSSHFSLVAQQLQHCNQKLAIFAAKIQKIVAIYKQNSQICNIESNIDSVLRLSSKLSSSRSFYQKHADWIDNNIIYWIRHYSLLLKKIKQSIDRRGQLVTKVGALPSEKVALAELLQEKVGLFDERFIKDWQNTAKEIEENIKSLYNKFNSQWRSHCKLMTKIWK